MGNTYRVFSFALLLGLLTTAPVWSQEAADKEPPEDAAFLVRALSHPDSRIRQTASLALTERGEAAIEALWPVLERGPELEAATAAIILGKLEKDALPQKLQVALYDLLSNPETEVWRWNVTATLLTRVAPKSLNKHVDLWIWSVRHHSPMIQLAGLRALSLTMKDGQPAQFAVLELLHRPRQPLTSYVLNDRIITDGLMGLELPQPEYDPLTILETLAAIEADPASMVEPLNALILSPIQYVRLDAAVLLGQLNPAKLSRDPRPDAARVLAALALNPAGRVREAALRRIGEMGKPAAVVVPALAQLLFDDVAEVRLQAAVSLGKMEEAAQAAIPALKQAIRFAKLDSEDTFDQMTAALKKIEDVEEKKDEEKPDTKDLM